MMIQDIAPLKLNNHYDPAVQAQVQDTVLIFHGRSVAIREGEVLTFPQARELQIDPSQLIYLFTIGEERFFLYPPQLPLPEEMTFCDLTALREGEPQPKYRMFAALTGKHLNDWYRDTQFCGRCGQRMTHSLKERAMQCPQCGYTAYPRIMPAVIVGVIKGDQLLITRYRQGYRHNALIAGFCEIGETMEETVAREVMEEAGLKVKNIRYYRSQPWGSAGDILAGFYCDADGDDLICMDREELKIAEWTSREAIVLQPDHSSLTNEMMERFKNGEPC